MSRVSCRWEGGKGGSKLPSPWSVSKSSPIKNGRALLYNTIYSTAFRFTFCFTLFAAKSVHYNSSRGGEFSKLWLIHHHYHYGYTDSCMLCILHYTLVSL